MDAWLRGDGDSRARGAAPGAGAGADGAAVTFEDGGQGALTLGAETWQLVDRGAADATRSRASRCATGGKGSQELGRRPAGGRWPLSLC